jgi:hypothetical protein
MSLSLVAMRSQSAPCSIPTPAPAASSARRPRLLKRDRPRRIDQYIDYFGDDRLTRGTHARRSRASRPRMEAVKRRRPKTSGLRLVSKSAQTCAPAQAGAGGR